MPKKQTRNGLYWFMQDLMPALKKEGRVFPNGMADVVPIALPRWKALSVEEKQRWEDRAKAEKKKAKLTADKHRLDNQGNIIADRRNDKEERAKKRSRDRQMALSRWPDQDEIVDEKFYFISFEYLCIYKDNNEAEHYLPCEVGLIEYSMRKGITKSFHKFIDCGGIPLGYRYDCKAHSEETHQIPLDDFELKDHNYRGMWMQMENFVNPNGEKPEYPQLYCKESEMECVQYCMEWLHAHACIGRQNRLRKIFVIQDMIVDLYAHKNMAISEASAQEILTTAVYDYEMNTRCKWHEDNQNKHCALGTVKRHAFSLSQSLNVIYPFDLTPAHMPEVTIDQPFNIIEPPPPAMPLGGSSMGAGHGRGRSIARQDDEDSLFGSRDVRYKVDPVVVKLGPDDSDEEYDDADEESRAPSTVSAATSSWSRPTVDTIGLDDEESFPSLGGSVKSGPKFAARQNSAPDPEMLPTPSFGGSSNVSVASSDGGFGSSGWAPSASYISKRQQELGDKLSKPGLRDVLMQRDPNELVAQGYKFQDYPNKEPKQPEPPVGMGRGARPRGPQQGPGVNPWAGGASKATGPRPQSGGSQNPWAAGATKAPQPTQNAGVRQPNLGGIGRGGVNPYAGGASKAPASRGPSSQQPPARWGGPSQPAPAAPSPWAGPSGGGSSVRSTPAPSEDGDFPSLQASYSGMSIGRGRGRGILGTTNKASAPQVGGSTAVKPPPGFGRGMNIDS